VGRGDSLPKRNPKNEREREGWRKYNVHWGVSDMGDRILGGIAIGRREGALFKI